MYKNFIELCWDIVVIYMQNTCELLTNVMKFSKESEERNSEVLKVWSLNIKRNRTI